MEGTYDVKLGTEAMGKVYVMKKGLYYRFECACSLCGDIMHDLTLQVGEQEIHLGLLIPQNGVWRVNTQLPIKQVGKGIPTFYIKPRHIHMNGQVYHVKPDEPFRYLDSLESMYLTKQNNKIVLLRHDKK